MWTSGGESLDLDADELSLIDCGITTLRNVPLKFQLLSLNLHCNQIEQIEGMDYLTHLRHLDLSSNHIQRMDGLDSLVSLRTLNLSCNLIEHVSGFNNLRWVLLQNKECSATYNNNIYMHHLHDLMTFNPKHPCEPCVGLM